MKTSAIIAVAATGILAGAATAGTVDPQVIEVDVSNLLSFDAQGLPGNDTLEVLLPAGMTQVIGIGWDVNLQTFGASWASEAAFSLGDLGGDPSLFLRPAAGVNEPLGAPTNFASPIINLVDLELDFSVASGVLALELFETFDDIEGEADAQWLENSVLLVQVIPGPGALALLGAAGMVGTRRRRA